MFTHGSVHALLGQSPSLCIVKVPGVEPATSGPKLMARILSQEPQAACATVEAVGNLCAAAARASEDTKSALMDSSYPDAALAVAGMHPCITPGACYICSPRVRICLL